MSKKEQEISSGKQKISRGKRKISKGERKMSKKGQRAEKSANVIGRQKLSGQRLKKRTLGKRVDVVERKRAKLLECIGNMTALNKIQGALLVQMEQYIGKM